MISFSNQTKNRVPLGRWQRLVAKFLIKHRLHRQEVSVVFCGDRLIRGLNQRYLKRDAVTDVLAFREKDSRFIQAGVLGEIFIDYRQIKRQAKRSGLTVNQELAYILTHGLLHLAGYDDRAKAGAKKMDQLAQKFLNNLHLL